MSLKGTLHLIPVNLGQHDPEYWLPVETRAIAARLDTYIVENAKTARAFLKRIGTSHSFQNITLYPLTNKTNVNQIQDWLKPILNGAEIGLVSEAGCPAVADPGSRVVEIAHHLDITVRPWVGPCSIVLGLMASGLEGQRFVFHGYSPLEPTARLQQLRQWEQLSARHKQTQIFIETPYRNNTLFTSLISGLQSDTQLCVARSLTDKEEWIRTYSIAEWRLQPVPDLDKRPTLFLFLAR